MPTDVVKYKSSIFEAKIYTMPTDFVKHKSSIFGAKIYTMKTSVFEFKLCKKHKQSLNTHFLKYKCRNQMLRVATCQH